MQEFVEFFVNIYRMTRFFREEYLNDDDALGIKMFFDVILITGAHFGGSFDSETSFCVCFVSKNVVTNICLTHVNDFIGIEQNRTEIMREFVYKNRQTHTRKDELQPHHQTQVDDF